VEFPLLVNTPAALQWYQVARQRSSLGEYLFYGNKIGKTIFVYGNPFGLIQCLLMKIN
jgi:hypothetical protein